MARKGIHVHVLRSPGIDCTCNGVTKRYERFLLVGVGVPEHFEASEGEPVLMLIKRNIGGQYLHAEPLDGLLARQAMGEKDGKWYMAGGNFVYSHDSRYRQGVCPYPISVHDRCEGV